MKHEQELSFELENKLKPYANNEDFVDGVLATTDHADDMKTLLDYIDAGDNVTANSIIELSYHLRCIRDGEPEYMFKKSSFNNFK